VRGGYRSCRTRLLDIPTQGERGSRMPRGGSGDRYTLACADWRVDMPLPWPKPTWLPVKYSKHFVAFDPDIVGKCLFRLLYSGGVRFFVQIPYSRTDYCCLSLKLFARSDSLILCRRRVRAYRSHRGIIDKILLFKQGTIST